MGYHLYKSGQFHLFPRIYLDLGFIEAVLKANGPVDLLNDFKKYEDQIMGESKEFMEELNDYESFARTVGAVVNTAPQSDIIQLALR